MEPPPPLAVIVSKVDSAVRTAEYFERSKMAHNMNKRASGKLNVSITRLIWVAVLISVAVSGAFAQGNSAASAAESKTDEVILPGATYDVATIKPHNPNVNISFSPLPNGGFIYTGMSL